MIIHDRKPTDRNRKKLGELLESVFKPFLSVVGPFAEQECTSHTSRHAVVPASDRSINQSRTSDRHRSRLLVYACSQCTQSQYACQDRDPFLRLMTPAYAHRTRYGRSYTLRPFAFVLPLTGFALS